MYAMIMPLSSFWVLAVEKLLILRVVYNFYFSVLVLRINSLQLNRSFYYKKIVMFQLNDTNSVKFQILTYLALNLQFELNSYKFYKILFY